MANKQQVIETSVFRGIITQDMVELYKNEAPLMSSHISFILDASISLSLPHVTPLALLASAKSHAASKHLTKNGKVNKPSQVK